MSGNRRFTERLTWSKRTGKPFSHGATGYNTHGCRCDVCYTAWAESPARVREREIKRLGGAA